MFGDELWAGVLVDRHHDDNFHKKGRDRGSAHNGDAQMGLLLHVLYGNDLKKNRNCVIFDNFLLYKNF